MKKELSNVHWLMVKFPVSNPDVPTLPQSFEFLRWSFNYERDFKSISRWSFHSANSTVPRDSCTTLRLSVELEMKTFVDLALSAFIGLSPKGKRQGRPLTWNGNAEATVPACQNRASAMPKTVGPLVCSCRSNSAFSHMALTCFSFKGGFNLFYTFNSRYLNRSGN